VPLKEMEVAEVAILSSVGIAGSAQKVEGDTRMCFVSVLL
jgi:hypothetical protein